MNLKYLYFDLITAKTVFSILSESDLLILDTFLEKHDWFGMSDTDFIDMLNKFNPEILSKLTLLNSFLYPEGSTYEK